MVERNDWRGAAELQVQPTQFAYVDAITHFARALGAARSGNPDAATADVAKLSDLREKLRQANDEYWTEQVDIQWQVATAWVLHARNQQAAALQAMSVAADTEDKTEKSVVTPGSLAPARELYGAMLLGRGMAREALAAFEATLAKEPNRFNAIAGAAKAAEALGENTKAKSYYQRLAALGADGNSDRAAVVGARESLSKN
jgi:tetratricopeptide (TPR) repeat protein